MYGGPWWWPFRLLLLLFALVVDPKPANDASGEIGVESNGVSGGVEKDEDCCAEMDDNEFAFEFAFIVVDVDDDDDVDVRCGSELSDDSDDDGVDADEAGESTSNSISSGSNAATPPVIDNERLFRVCPLRFVVGDAGDICTFTFTPPPPAREDSELRSEFAACCIAATTAGW